jgi:hypothetical protein
MVGDAASSIVCKPMRDSGCGLLDVAQRDENFLRCAHLNGKRRVFTIGHHPFRFGTSSSRNKDDRSLSEADRRTCDVKHNTCSPMCMRHGSPLQSQTKWACIAHMTRKLFFCAPHKNSLTSEIQSLQ